MSVIYCHPCGQHIDTDFDTDHCYDSDHCDGCPCDPEHWWMWYTPEEAHEMRIDEGLDPISDHERRCNMTDHEWYHWKKARDRDEERTDQKPGE